MDKVAKEAFAEALRETPGVIRSLVNENEALRQKIASFERAETIKKIASDMHEKGLLLDLSSSELEDRLMHWDQQGKLAEIQRAVEWTGPDMGDKIAQVRDEGLRQGGGGSVGTSDFERYLMGE